MIGLHFTACCTLPLLALVPGPGLQNRGGMHAEPAPLPCIFCCTCFEAAGHTLPPLAVPLCPSRLKLPLLPLKLTACLPLLTVLLQLDARPGLERGGGCVCTHPHWWL